MSSNGRPLLNIAPPVHRVVNTLELPADKPQQVPSLLATYQQHSYTKLPPQYIRQTSSSCDSATIEWVPHDYVCASRDMCKTCGHETHVS